jgi:uncharacterized protein (UPF0303 family)
MESREVFFTTDYGDETDGTNWIGRKKAPKDAL